MSINNTDKFLVNRSNSSYHIEAQDLMADLLDTDLMLVNRGGASYKVTGADIKSSIAPAVVAAPYVLQPEDGVGTPLSVSGSITAIEPAVTATYSDYKGTYMHSEAFDSGTSGQGVFTNSFRYILAGCESLGITPTSNVSINMSGDRNITVFLRFSDNSTFEQTIVGDGVYGDKVFSLGSGDQGKTIKDWQCRVQFGSVFFSRFSVDGTQLVDVPLSDAAYTVSSVGDIVHGDQVKQNGNTASGTVTNITGNVISLDNELGTWAIGNAMIELQNYNQYENSRISKDNPTFTITSSQVFNASWSGTDLQIATDSGFTNVVHSVNNYQTSQTTIATSVELSTWTDHYVRARHRGTDAGGSVTTGNWSDAIHFATKGS